MNNGLPASSRDGRDAVPEKTIQIIAIDGPAGAGKSTVAKRLAQRLGLAYLDTGAMYRALTLKAVRQGMDLEDESALEALARGTLIDLRDRDGGVGVFLDGEDVSEAVRTPEITNKTFYLARASRVRAIMVEWQRAIGKRRGLVAEGRDIGTVVFPQATNKFYLDADVNERARRRIAELNQKGTAVDPDQLTAEIKERDNKDLTRRVGPLKKAEDAVLIDSTGISVEDVVEKMMKYIR